MASHKTMAEQAGWTLVELPALVLGPQMRELLASEARSRARGGIVPGHPIAADRPHELACLKRREAPPRLASDEQRRQSGGMAKQASEVTLAEMMEKEIGDNHVELVSFFEKLKYVRHAWLSPPAECGKALARFLSHNILPIEQSDAYIAPARHQAPRHRQHENPVPRLDLDDRSRCPG